MSSLTAVLETYDICINQADARAERHEQIARELRESANGMRSRRDLVADDIERFSDLLQVSDVSLEDPAVAAPVPPPPVRPDPQSILHGKRALPFTEESKLDMGRRKLAGESYSQIRQTAYECVDGSRRNPTDPTITKGMRMVEALAPEPAPETEAELQASVSADPVEAVRLILQATELAGGKDADSADPESALYVRRLVVYLSMLSELPVTAIVTALDITSADVMRAVAWIRDIKKQPYSPGYRDFMSDARRVLEKIDATA